MFTVKFSDDPDFSDSYTLLYCDGTVTATWQPEDSNVDDFDVEEPRGSFSYCTGNGRCELTWDTVKETVTMTVAKHGDGRGGDLNMCIVNPKIVESLRDALRTIIQHAL
jgi:hypothetical protein